MGTMTAPKKPTKKMGRPRVDNPKKPVLSIRGSEEWRTWLAEFAEHKHMPTAVVVDQALIAYAQASGFGKPMPNR